MAVYIVPYEVTDRLAGLSPATWAYGHGQLTAFFPMVSGSHP